MDEILSDALDCFTAQEAPNKALSEALVRVAKALGSRDLCISLVDESKSFSRVLRHIDLSQGLAGGFFVPISKSVCGQQELREAPHHCIGYPASLCEFELLGEELLLLPLRFLGDFYGTCCFASPTLDDLAPLRSLEIIGSQCASIVATADLLQQKQQADYDNRLYHQLAETLETMGRQQDVESLFRYITQRLRSLLRIHNVTFLQLRDKRLVNPLVAKSEGFEVPVEWQGSVNERRPVAMQVSVQLQTQFFPISQGDELLGAVQVVSRPTELPKREHGRMLEILLSATGTCMKKTASLKQAVEAQSNAEHANQAKTEFLANISHEIRTPLTSIVGLSSLLSEQCNDPEQLELLDTIVRSADILKSVISDLLDMSRIESGRIELTPKSVFLGDFVDHCVSMLEGPAEKKGLSLTRGVDSNAPKALVFDEARVAQILLNLISNAIKYTDRGSVRLEVSYNQLVGFASFRVIDTGLGIPELNLNQVFEPFYQYDGTQHRDRGGVGLGLAIAQKLASLMDGEIEVKSRLGDGSCFTLNLPLQSKEIEVEPKQEELLESAFEGGNPRVMLVDDNSLNRMTGRALLHRFCREVVVADGGRHAIEMVREFEPDVILMDISMPEVDGYEATRRIRQLKLESQPHIIAVTGHVQAAIEQRTIEAGMDGFLEKPFTLEQLYAQVMAHCGDAITI